MKRKTRSILEELSSIGRQKNIESLIETRGANIIESCSNFLDLIRQNFTEEETQELEKRFLGAIRLSDPRKFQRGMKRVLESRNKKENDSKL
jgi:hypothetical protein